MIKFPKPLQLPSPARTENNQSDSRFNALSPIQLNYLRVKWIIAMDKLSHFWLSRQSKKIINDIEVGDIDDLENTVTWSFLTVPFLIIIWMYFFYRLPTHHPELFSIAIGIPICFVSFRLVHFMRKSQ